MMFSPKDISSYVELTEYSEGLDLKFRKNLLNSPNSTPLDLAYLQKESGLHKTLFVQMINILVGTEGLVRSEDKLTVDLPKLKQFFITVDFARDILKLNSKSVPDPVNWTHRLF